MVTSRANEYRRLARECLAMAHTIATEDTRATLVGMAQIWLRLAEEALLPPSAVTQSQPAVQQQQQVQPKDDDDTG